ncbi:MAG: copper resistance protein CopC [Dehalococcoidia bacterium]|jgi:methionine-rich copper-binding protein CopC
MKWLAALLASVTIAFAAVSVAWAHAEPATAKPGDGAIIKASPGEVVLEMSQDMGRQAGLNDIDVFDASGKEVTTVAAVVDNADRKKLSVAIPSDLPAGVYTVKWKTSSAEDGDAANGQISFTIDPNGTPIPGKEQLRDDILGGSTPSPEGDQATVTIGGSGNDGVTWVLVIAVGVAMLVLGAGGTFLLIQRKP